MSTKVKHVYRNYLLPAAVFQGVIIGGGYATGREIIEFITINGPLGGLISCLTIALGFAIVLSLSFAFAKTFGTSNYRTFLTSLLGKGWVLYEILFILLLVLIIAIVSAAATDTAKSALSLPESYSFVIIFTLIVGCNYFGKILIQNLLAGWTFLLMISLLFYTVACLTQLDAGSFTDKSLYTNTIDSVSSGFKFAVYNSALVPVLIYCTTQIEGKKAAFKAGIFAGIMGAVPALLLHLAFVTRYPEVIEQGVPTFWLLRNSDFPQFEPLYLIILFGTIILTAVGLLHGVNERINGWLGEYNRHELGKKSQAAISATLVLISVLFSKIGIISLVAKGYGWIAWGFFFAFTLPLLIIGTLKLIKRSFLDAS